MATMVHIGELDASIPKAEILTTGPFADLVGFYVPPDKQAQQEVADWLSRWAENRQDAKSLLDHRDMLGETEMALGHRVSLDELAQRAGFTRVQAQAQVDEAKLQGLNATQRFQVGNLRAGRLIYGVTEPSLSTFRGLFGDRMHSEESLYAPGEHLVWLHPNRILGRHTYGGQTFRVHPMHRDSHLKPGVVVFVHTINGNEPVLVTEVSEATVVALLGRNHPAEFNVDLRARPLRADGWGPAKPYRGMVGAFSRRVMGANHGLQSWLQIAGNADPATWLASHQEGEQRAQANARAAEEAEKAEEQAEEAKHGPWFGDLSRSVVGDREYRVRDTGVAGVLRKWFRQNGIKASVRVRRYANASGFDFSPDKDRRAFSEAELDALERIAWGATYRAGSGERTHQFGLLSRHGGQFRVAHDQVDEVRHLLAVAAQKAKQSLSEVGRKALSWKKPRKPRKASTRKPTHTRKDAAAVEAAARTFVDADKRWSERRARGLTDAELKEAVSQEFGISGATVVKRAPLREVFVHYKGGSNPQVWYEVDGATRTVSGKRLLTAARAAFSVPQPKPKAGHALPKALEGIVAPLLGSWRLISYAPAGKGPLGAEAIDFMGEMGGERKNAQFTRNSFADRWDVELVKKSGAVEQAYSGSLDACVQTLQKWKADADRLDAFQRKQRGEDQVVLQYLYDQGVTAKGDTRPYKVNLKLLGFRWYRKGGFWYIPRTRQEPWALVRQRFEKAEKGLREVGANLVVDLPVTVRKERQAAQAGRLRDDEALAEAQRLGHEAYGTGYTAPVLDPRWKKLAERQAYTIEGDPGIAKAWVKGFSRASALAPVAEIREEGYALDAAEQGMDDDEAALHRAEREADRLRDEEEARNAPLPYPAAFWKTARRAHVVQPAELEPQTYYDLWQRVGKLWVKERSYMGHYIRSSLLDGANGLRAKAGSERPWAVTRQGDAPAGVGKTSAAPDLHHLPGVSNAQAVAANTRSKARADAAALDAETVFVKIKAAAEAVKTVEEANLWFRNVDGNTAMVAAFGGVGPGGQRMTRLSQALVERMQREHGAVFVLGDDIGYATQLTTEPEQVLLHKLLNLLRLLWSKGVFPAGVDVGELLSWMNNHQDRALAIIRSRLNPEPPEPSSCGCKH